MRPYRCLATRPLRRPLRAPTTRIASPVGPLSARNVSSTTDGPTSDLATIPIRKFFLGDPKFDDNSSTHVLARLIKVCASSDPIRVRRAVTSLVQDAKTASSADASRWRDTIGLAGWEVDRIHYDYIFRHFALRDLEDADALVRDVQAVAHELDHHPSISGDQASAETGHAYLITVVCKTHQPPGLSMRDVKLARSIDNIVAKTGYDVAWFEDRGMSTSRGKWRRDRIRARARMLHVAGVKLDTPITENSASMKSTNIIRKTNKFPAT